MAHKIIIENKADRIIAEQKIYEIAEILKHHSFPHSEFGFLGGNSGIIMFLYYFSRFSHDNSYSQIATSRIMQLIEKVQEEENLDWSIGSGLAGVCYTFQHLQKYEFITANSSDILGDLDNYFHQVMLLRMKNGNYDFFDGALGIGLYLLSREYFTKQKDYLLDLVGLIYNLTIAQSPQTIASFTRLFPSHACAFIFTRFKGFISLRHLFFSLATKIVFYHRTRLKICRTQTGEASKIILLTIRSVLC